MSQSRKIIYIIGANPSDLFDCTIQAIKKIEISESIILSKEFDNSFIKMLKSNNKKIYYQEDFSQKNNHFLWKKLLALFQKNNSIAHLINGDPFLDHNSLEELKFFNAKTIECQIIPGVINVINCLNKNTDLLTDREKNSSVTVIKKFDIKIISKIIENSYFEKLIVYLQTKEEFSQINLLIKENSLERGLIFNLIIQGSYILSNDLNTKFTGELPNPSYIIIHRDEKI